MSSTPTVNTLINSSNCTVLGNSSTGNALSVQQVGAGNVAAFSNAAGNVAIFITSTSNVGIGVTTPIYPLQVHTDQGGVNPTDTVLRLYSTAYATGTSNTALRIEKGNGYGGVISGYLAQGVGSGIQLSALNGGTQTDVMNITNSGRVGIGTTNPGTILDMYGGAGTVASIRSSANGATRNVGVSLQSANSTTPSGIFMDAADRMAFYTFGASRMSIDFNGNVGIGLTTPLHPLHVSGTTLTASQVVKYINYAGVPNWTAVTQQTALSIYGSGSIGTSDAFCLFSDERIKVKEQPSKTYLDLVNAVDVKTFSYIDKIQYGPQKRVGFFAQEVEKVLPGAVTHLKDFIPNIFKKCEATDKKVVISGHSLCPEQVIRVMHHESIDECKVVSVDGDTIEVDKVIDGNVFIYGTQVDDFRVLNYDYMSSVAFGGLKELHALVKTQQKTIEALESRLAALEARA